MMNKKQRQERFEKLAEYGCVICRQPTQIHHLLGLEFSGMGQKADDSKTISLCHKHHVGIKGIHTLGVQTWEQKYGKQKKWLDFVNITIEKEK